MTISIHPARRPSVDVPPGTWDGTKQDAVLATAQLQEIWERKKRGENLRFGQNEYDSQMANAQLRAFKLTKSILRNARRSSASDVNRKIEEMGFVVDLESHHPPLPGPPPSVPLPHPPNMRKSSRIFREPSGAYPQMIKAASAPASPLRAPVVPKKATNRQSSLPPLTRIPQRQPSMEFPQQRPSPSRRPPSRVPSPAPSVVSVRRDLPPPVPPKSPSPDAEKDVLPVLPFRRKPVPKPTFETHSMRPPTPVSPRTIPEADPPLPPRSPYRTSVYAAATPPLIPKRRSLQRSISFRFGDGLQYSVSKSLYSELSSALDELQRSLGGSAVEVH
jgi:hypothetical protein